MENYRVIMIKKQIIHYQIALPLIQFTDKAYYSIGNLFIGKFQDGCVVWPFF